MQQYKWITKVLYAKLKTSDTHTQKKTDLTYKKFLENVKLETESKSEVIRDEGRKWGWANWQEEAF